MNTPFDFVAADKWPRKLEDRGGPAAGNFGGQT